MLGTGTYLTENITKADEHTIKDDRHWPAIHAVVLSKTVLGNIKIQEWNKEVNKNGYDSTLYNSQVGFGAAFREFVVADKNAAMPLYIILYTRNY